MPTKHRVLIAVLAVLGTALVLLSTSRYGAGVSPDSVRYIATARNIVGGAGVSDYTGAALVSQPPLYPAVLALAAWLVETDPLVLAAAINALIFGLTVYLGGSLAFQYLRAMPGFVVMAMLGILVSIPLFAVSIMAWSEPLFILFTIFSLLFARAYLEEKKTASLVLLSFSTMLACLTRYIGVALIPWGALIVLRAHRDALRRGMRRLAVFVLISAVPIGGWLLRNYAVAGTPFGPRASSLYSLAQNVRFAYESTAAWYVPRASSAMGAALMLAVTAVAAIAAVGSRNNPDGGARQIRPLALFVSIYVAFLVASSTIATYDAIGDRLLSPIYVPVTLALLILAQALAQRYRGRPAGSIVRALVTVGLGFWLLYMAGTTARNAANQFTDGSGYSAAPWKASQTIRYVAAHSSMCPIYTNGADAVYLLANLHVHVIPSRNAGANAIANPWSPGGTWPPEGRACIVWFNAIQRPYLFTPAELTSVGDLDEVIPLNDGTIYVVSRQQESFLMAPEP